MVAKVFEHTNCLVVSYGLLVSSHTDAVCDVIDRFGLAFGIVGVVGIWGAVRINPQPTLKDNELRISRCAHSRSERNAFTLRFKDFLLLNRASRLSMAGQNY